MGASRLFYRFKTKKQKELDAESSLFDLVMLEISVTSSKNSLQEDQETLDRIRSRFCEHNRRADVKVFLDTASSIGAEYERAGERGRLAIRQTALRLVSSPDFWLQTAGARIASDIGLRLALSSLEPLLGRAQAERLKIPYGGDANRQLWKSEMEKAVKILSELRESAKVNRRSSHRPRGSKSAR